MVSDGHGSLPLWPAGAGDGPGDDGPPSADGWLLAAGVAYPFAGFGLLLSGCGGVLGPASCGPEVILVPALAAVGLAVGLRPDRARLSRPARVAFVGWVGLVAFGQFWVWAEAVASV